MAYIQDWGMRVQAQPQINTTRRAFLHLSQNENGRMLNIRITDVNIPTGSTAVLAGTKPDGTVYSQAGTLAGNTATFAEDVQMTAVAGTWDAKITVTNGGNCICTARITITIDPDTVAGGAVPSDSQLDGIIAECRAIADSVRKEAYGSPLVADAVEDMTDQSRVYVYTGSETGYTSGHWYYYTGTVWADGGVYNAVAVDTDTTLTIAGKAADAKKVGDELTGVKEDLNRLSSLDFDTIANTFINKNNGGTGTSGGYVASDYVPCNGCVYLYTYTANDNSGYAFYDKNKQPLSYGGTYEIRRTWTKLTAPSGAVYFRASCGANQIDEFKIMLPVTDNVSYLIGSESATKATAETTKAVVDEKTYSFKNNMSTDGIANLPNCTIYRNGSASPSNYGKVGSKYFFEIPQKKTHVYYEFKFDEPIASAYGSAQSKRLVSLFGAGIFLVQFLGGLYQNTELFPAVSLQCVSGANSNTAAINAIKYNRLNGQDAFSVKYTNEVDAESVCTIEFSDSSCVVNVDGESSTISVTSSTTITDLVEALNEISGISATVIVAEAKTYGDLLPVVSKTASTSTTVNCIYNGTKYDNTQYIDAPNIYIPLAMSDDWHSVEMVLDPDGKVFCAFDGITVSVDYGTGIAVNNQVVLNGSDMPILIRNLEIDYDSYGDAELVDNLIDPSLTPAKQLISSHNPRLLIYEGHGVDIGADDDMPISDTMACSTERLRILFSKAKAKGYVPVTWDQIVHWKKNGKRLPKRCFNLMFDDWRFENYIDYDKRKPFTDFNVKAGLAVITNQTALTDNVTINDITYTAEQAVDIVMTAGWYATSHTHGHRRLTSYTPTENETYLKEDVLEADRYGIHSNILVYPYGEIAQQFIPIMRNSGFALGVDVVKNYYNCKGSNDYNLTRVEIGTRVPLSTVLYPLV